MKNLLLPLLLFFFSLNQIFGQDNSRFIIFPGCEKFETKGNKQLKNCYSDSFNLLLKNETIKVLSDNNISIYDIKIDAKIFYEISEEGKYQNIKVEGTNLETVILNQSFFNMISSLNKKNKFIIPARNNEGEAAKLKFSVNFKIMNPP